VEIAWNVWWFGSFHEVVEHETRPSGVQWIELRVCTTHFYVQQLSQSFLDQDFKQCLSIVTQLYVRLLHVMPMALLVA
jgi:hypothetical protein